MILQILFASLSIMAVSLIGIITVWTQAGAFLERNLNYFVSFAAGVFLILFLKLTEEVLMEASTLLQGALWIIGGFILAFILVKMFPEGHSHHASVKGDTHAAQRLIIGDSFHNIGDGILLAIAFTTSPFLGFITAVSILFHEVIQEIAEFFVLKKSGYTTRGALQINFLTSSTLLIGSIGGYFFLESFSAFEIPALGLATGALFALLTQDLIPHSIKWAAKKGCGPNHMLAIAAGVLIMFLVLTLTAPAHSHEHDDDHYEEEIHNEH